MRRELIEIHFSPSNSAKCLFTLAAFSHCTAVAAPGMGLGGLSPPKTWLSPPKNFQSSYFENAILVVYVLFRDLINYSPPPLTRALYDKNHNPCEKSTLQLFFFSDRRYVIADESRGATFGWQFMLMIGVVAIGCAGCAVHDDPQGQMVAVGNLQDPFVPNFIKIKPALWPQIYRDGSRTKH